MQERSAAGLANPSDLPSPPAAIARVVRLASDPDITSDRLGAVIASDPAFTTELLRTVNSPFYGLKQPVTAASRAVTMLGIRSLRNLAICFAVRDSLRNSGFRASDLDTFWEDCLRRAVAARSVARATGTVPVDTAFTLGLLQDFGMLALLRSNRKEFANWPEWQKLLPNQRASIETERFGTRHDEVFSLLGQRWGLPEQLIQALAYHHEPDHPDCAADARDMARVARAADLVASLISGRTSAALAAVRDCLRADFKFDEAATDKLLEPLPLEVEQAAVGLGMRVARQPSFATILSEANRVLVDMNVSYEELTLRLERTLAEKEALTLQLEEANSQLSRLAYFDPLTGLSNRRHFDTNFRDMLGRASTEGLWLTLLMVDLDRFKSVNDIYGHAVGDAVLRMAANAIASAAHDGDVKARLGGEELAVLLYNTDPVGGMATAERLREAVARGAVTTSSGPIRVTASFGVVCFQGTRQRVDLDRLASMLTELGDKALYESKNAGRNRCTAGGVVR